MRYRVWMPIAFCLMMTLVPAHAANLSAEQANSLLKQTTEQLKAMTADARKLFLGDRKPGKQTCVKPVKIGQVKGLDAKLLGRIGLANGGCGTKTVETWMERPVNTVEDEFTWHQDKYKTYLGQMAQDCKQLEGKIKPVRNDAEALVKGINAWTAVPQGITPAQVNKPDDWPTYCFAQLNKALAAGDLAASKHWANEFHAAVFGVADMNLWLDFLARNQIDAINFAGQNKYLFVLLHQVYAKQKVKYNKLRDVGRFPGGMIFMNGLDNFLELERQGELMFDVPDDWVKAAAAAPKLEQAYYLPPDTRETFMKLRESFGRTNQPVFDKAAESPFDRSFLANHLFRIQTAGKVDEMAEVFKRADRNLRRAAANELMDVMMLRGATFAGMEWGDRFDKRMMDAADKMKGSPIGVLAKAHEKTAETNKKYIGMVLTLREGMDIQRLDCVRSTDMINSLVRNAGYPGAAVCRWSRGGSGHSIAAFEYGSSRQPREVTIDGLVPKDRPNPWPNWYFNRQKEFCAEIYKRGLDNYVWAEGYIIQGPTKGVYARAAIPYLPAHPKPTIRKLR